MELKIPGLTPKEEAPKEEAPKEEAPKEEAPKEEAPKEEAPKEEAPKEEKQTTPKDTLNELKDAVIEDLFEKLFLIIIVSSQAFSDSVLNWF